MTNSRVTRTAKLERVSSFDGPAKLALQNVLNDPLVLYTSRRYGGRVKASGAMLGQSASTRFTVIWIGA